MMNGVISKDDIESIIFDVKKWQRKFSREEDGYKEYVADDAFYDIVEQLTRLVEEVDMKDLSLLVQSK